MNTNKLARITGTSICNKAKNTLKYRRLSRVFLRESKLRISFKNLYNVFIVLHHKYSTDRYIL